MEATGLADLRGSPARRDRAVMRRAAGYLERLAAPPSTPRLPRVQYTPALVAYVTLLWVGIGVIALQGLSWSGDWFGAGLGGLMVAAVAFYSVPSFGDIHARWSASAFFHLAFAFTVGPPAIAALALGDALGNAVQRRPGWFRIAFNVANHFLGSVAAWKTFHAIAGSDPRGAHVVVAGAVAGGVAMIVNHILIGVVLRLATEEFHLRQWVAELRRLTPYHIGFGVTASGASILYQLEGSLGVVTPLVPIVLAQATLVVLARRIRAHNEANAAHAREREALLQRAVDASESERLRIAADLHDGVVQDLAAVSYACSAATMVGDNLTEREQKMGRLLKEASEATRTAMRELRTLMIELAPPRLQEDGLQTALAELLAKLERNAITTHLNCPAELRLGDRQLRLVYRTVQEALRNILKHAHCGNVWVSVGIENGQVAAAVRDDGRGFTTDERIRRQAQGHNGLGLLQQTVEDGGAELLIRSAPGKGVAIMLQMALSEPDLPSRS